LRAAVDGQLAAVDVGDLDLGREFGRHHPET
jgi:hypothetical protein